MSQERDDFSSRLRQSLREAGYDAYGPTNLAHHFNSRFPGRAISVHAVRKWLLGEAIPTQEKIRVLSDWLGVSASWLRFGEPDLRDSDFSPGEKIDPALLKMLNDMRRLDAGNRTLVLEFLRLLIRLKAASNKKSPYR